MSMTGGYSGLSGGYDPSDPYGLKRAQMMAAQQRTPGMPGPGAGAAMPPPGGGMGMPPGGAMPPPGGAAPMPGAAAGGLVDPTADPTFTAGLLKQQNQGLGGQLAHQRKMADAMRQGAQDQMAGVHYGNGQYAAPGLANVAASVLGSWRAGKLDKEAQGTADKLDTANSNTAGAWFGAKRRGAPQRQPQNVIQPPLEQPDY